MKACYLSRRSDSEDGRPPEISRSPVDGGRCNLKVRLYHPLTEPTTRLNCITIAPHFHAQRPEKKGSGEENRWRLSFPGSAGVIKSGHTPKYV